jgi:ATP-dependent helicase/nuclease subunit A
MFGLERNAGAAFGSALHALVAAVAWGGPAAVEQFAAEWPAQGAAGEEALACLRAPGLAPVWTRPSVNTEVWRERAFEVVLDGIWLTGVFDRVLVERDATGAASGAWVFDFKTDRPVPGGDDTMILEKHADQLQLYRRVAAVLSGLPEARVECALVMTATRSLIEVPPVP